MIEAMDRQRPAGMITRGSTPSHIMSTAAPCLVVRAVKRGILAESHMYLMMPLKSLAVMGEAPCQVSGAENVRWPFWSMVAKSGSEDLPPSSKP